MSTVKNKKKVKVDPVGQVHIKASFNNIIVSVTNANGDVISWSSAGKMGFRGSKKNTPYAAQLASQDCGKVAYDLGLRKVDVFRKRFCYQKLSCSWYRSAFNPRYNSTSSQRLSSSKTQTYIIIHYLD
jgi:ribosomal protein S11